MTATSTHVRRIAGVGVFAAIVVALQILATFVPLGPFAITLVLVPIVIGAALYGVAAGAVLGATFSMVVLIMTINGTDVGAHMLWVANPFATAAVILARGICAGAAAGAVYRLLAKRNKFVGVVCAAIVCPIVNTGLFLLAMFFIFPDFIELWGAGVSTVYFLFIGLAGINFLLEMGINVVLSPTIVRIIDATKRSS